MYMYLKRYENQRSQIEINIKETSTKTTSVRKKSEAKMELKGPPFGLYKITMFCPQDHASTTESRQWHSSANGGISYKSLKYQSVFSETIRLGENGHHGGESSVEVVTKENPAFVTPDWMEERPSPETKPRNLEDLDINILLKYPNSYVPERNAPDPMKIQYESAIHPEVAKRDKSVPVIPVQREKPEFLTPQWMEARSSLETKRRNPEVSDINNLLKYPNSYVPEMASPDPMKVQYEGTIRPEVAKRDNSVPVLQDFEVDDEDDEDEEYDEFEEVIVIVDVQRKPVWHRGLELPKAETQKVGIPIQDLLQLPTRRVKRESALDKLSIDSNNNDITIIDEKIEFVQRPAVVQEAQNLASIFQGF